MANKVGKIDLPGLFEAERKRLINAVSQGDILHKTNNLREAGARLEAEFRDFLGSRVPPRFQVQAGYLFDAQSTCTPQIDAIVIDGDQAHEVMRSEGAVYVPYPSGVVVVEIKNSAGAIKSSLGQLSKTLTAIKAMQKLGAAALQAAGRRGRAVAPSAVITVGDKVAAISKPDLAGGPLSVLVIGSTGKTSPVTFRSAYNSVNNPPDYLIILDKGVIITRYSQDFKFPSLQFHQYGFAGPWGIFSSNDESYPEGRALLWLYAAIADYLNLFAHDGEGGIAPFTQQIAKDFPLTLKSDLSSAKTW
ncbi:DUF6602 domain-containing protein [Caulobacter soli]|uniref:DUF6602 domain-containing protein n=1 Tax=Caulobacter soli TaxID=2708539 RepID=UPI0013EC907B|nr:DUF6602 domain-containing protein [Caulobacter soli]